MNRTTRLALPAVGLAAGLLLSACGGSSSSMGGHDMSAMGDAGSTASSMPMTSATATTEGSSAPASAEHNGADVTFATEMIPHHQQATQMADMAAVHATNAQVKTLAVQIKAAQTPEITTMQGWLKAWGAPLPDASAGMSGMDMGSTMMSADEMAQLDKATGAAFDRMWLQMMTKHHEGAIMMAKAELSAGSSTDAKTLAQNIIDSQSKEIATMASLLKTLS